MTKIYLVCGVPGSGKSWVCEKLKDKYNYIRHDDYMGGGYADALSRATRSGAKTVLADCPFQERKLVEELACQGIDPVCFFIVEPVEVIRKRYEERDLKPIPKQHLTRALSIRLRAIEWQAFFGNSMEVLKHLKDLPNG
jgi:hypothetical protein